MTLAQHRLTIPPELAGRRLDQAVAALLPDYSRSRLKAWILSGHVKLDGADSTPRSKVVAGQIVDVVAELPTESAVESLDIPLDVIHEDEHLIVLNKPAGLVVHPGAGNRDGTLVSGLLHRWPELAGLPRGGLLHRLDKDTTGLLAIARSLPAHTRLVRDLHDRAITREYRAVCVGRLTAGGSVSAKIGRHPQHRTKMAVTERGREAVTHYRVLQRFAAHSFLALRLETGRTHQIRVHMAHLRHPLVGDTSYGGRRGLPAGADTQLISVLQNFPRQALHASRLVLRHPISEEILSLHAALPEDFRRLLAALSGGNADLDDLDALEWPTVTP